jgi:hypothetical protein
MITQPSSWKLCETSGWPESLLSCATGGHSAWKPSWYRENPSGELDDGYLIGNAFSEIESQLPLVPRILVILFDQTGGQVEIMPKSLDSETNRSHHAFQSLPTIPRGYYPSTSAEVGKRSMLQSSSHALLSVVRLHWDRPLSNGSLQQGPGSWTM